MKLVLVAGFNTRNGLEGPRVKLAAGKWKVITEHHIDSKLVLRSPKGTAEVKHDSIFVSDDEVFSLLVSSGTEAFINVFVEPVKAT